MELALMKEEVKSSFSIIDVIKKRREQKRLEYLRAECKRKFNGVLHQCCSISRNNHKIAFVVTRSVLGYPMLEQIDRPKGVGLYDTDDFVIVRDGYVYELTKRVE